MQTIECPRCGSDAIYNYGHLKNGQQRYLCLVCNRQFVPNQRPSRVGERPICPLCHGPMHIYMRSAGITRFRCAAYPQCRGYRKKES